MKILLFVALPLCLLPFGGAFADRPANEWHFEAPPRDAAARTAGADKARPTMKTIPPTNDRSQLAWLHQQDWLGERLAAKGLRLGAPLHIRIFKQTRELELYLRDGDRYTLFRTYPICAMSGTLGPKRFEGDLQAPEGFYRVGVEQLHPNSEFHLAFNLGYPNRYDRAQRRTGSNIMIHGGCASTGCFAMSDYYMEQIYVLAEAALRGGQSAIGVEIYPFRLTEANLRAYSGRRWIEFWRSLKPIHDHFLAHGAPAPVEASADGYRLRSEAREASALSAP